jgi:uncharacterized protein (DUF58 family)
VTAGVYTSLQELTRLRYQAQGFSFLPRQPIHSLLAGPHGSRLRGRGLDFEELRHYLPGDDIRSMDWKTTMRMRKPFVRVNNEERDRQAILVVDQRINMFFGSQVNMKSVTAAEVASLGAWRVLAAGDRPGAVVFNDSEITEIRPHRSKRRVMQILETLVQQNQQLQIGTKVNDNSTRLNDVLERVIRLAKHDCLVAVISDFSGADEHTKELMTRLAQHNDVLASLIYDPLETELPDLGRLVVSDGDLQLEVDSGNATLRRRFAEIFDDRLQQVRTVLLQRQIPVLPIHTAMPVAEQVRNLLGHAQRGARS